MNVYRSSSTTSSSTTSSSTSRLPANINPWQQQPGRKYEDSVADLHARFPHAVVQHLTLLFFCVC
jgi:hypothetical protein